MTFDLKAVLPPEGSEAPITSQDVYLMLMLAMTQVLDQIAMQIPVPVKTYPDLAQHGPGPEFWHEVFQKVGCAWIRAHAHIEPTPAMLEAYQRAHLAALRKLYPQLGNPREDMA